MRRLTLAISVLLIFITALSFAQQRGPKVFSPEPSFDMGYIPQRAKFGHRFWIYNIGTDSLNIRNVQVSCGCTKASSAVGMLAVNDSVPIDIVFDSGTRRLQQDKRVTVRTNDPGTGNLSLQFTAFVFTPAQEDTIGPVNFTQNKKLDATTDDLGKTFVIEYHNHSKEMVRPTLVRKPDDLIASVIIPDNPVKPGGVGKITIAFVKSVTDKNQHKSITVQFDDSHKSRYTIPVRLAESISSLKEKS